MSVIEFLCPNGHKIRCQSEQAGRPAKCPRCDVRFRVPDPSELEAGSSDALSKQDFANIDMADDKPSPQDFGPPKDMGPKKNQQMEFLCPNGHRLFGSPSLAGRAGECPDCGARFRIPSLDEISLDERPGEPDIGFNQPASQPVSPQDYPIGAPPMPSRSTATTGRPGAAGADLAQSAWEDEVMPATSWSIAAGSSLVERPLATLFATLWGLPRPKGARLEIQMRDGEAVVVEQFMANLSKHGHGVFGIRAPDNTFTLMAVAWDTIDRVLIRGLPEMPKP